MYIKYYNSGGHKYAMLLEAKRDHTNGQKYDKHLCHLGRVINEAEGVFKNRERGVFRYTMDEGYSDVEDTKSYMEYAYGGNLGLILDFGPEYIIIQSLKKNGLFDVFASVVGKDKFDTLMSLVLHSMLFDEASQYAEGVMLNLGLTRMV